MNAYFRRLYLRPRPHSVRLHFPRTDEHECPVYYGLTASHNTTMTSAAAIVGEDTPRHHDTQNNTHKSNGKETGSKDTKISLLYTCTCDATTNTICVLSARHSQPPLFRQNLSLNNHLYVDSFCMLAVIKPCPPLAFTIPASDITHLPVVPTLLCRQTRSPGVPLLAFFTAHLGDPFIHVGKLVFKRLLQLFCS